MWQNSLFLLAPFAAQSGGSYCGRLVVGETPGPLPPAVCSIKRLRLGRRQPTYGRLIVAKSPAFPPPSAEQRGGRAERDDRVCKGLLRRGSLLALYGTKWEWEWERRGGRMQRDLLCWNVLWPSLPAVCGAKWGAEGDSRVQEDFL